MLVALGIPRADCTTESYGRLFLLWREQNHSPADNLTFAEIAPELAAR